MLPRVGTAPPSFSPSTASIGAVNPPEPVRTGPADAIPVGKASGEPVASAPAIGHFLGSYLRLTENWIHHQIRFARGVRPVVLAKRTENLDRFAVDSLHVPRRLPLPLRYWNSLAGAVLGYEPFFRDACRAEGVRLLHAHFGYRGAKALGLARELRVPLVTSFYGADMFVHPHGTDGLRKKYGRLFARGDGFIVEGPAARARLVNLGCPAEKLHVHRLGVDLERLRFVERDRDETSPLRVLIAARFQEKKGLPYAVEGFCRVARTDPRLHLTIVGGPGGSRAGKAIESELRALARRSGVEERVRFTGLLPPREMHALARDHHLFLHPSVAAENGDSEGGHPVVLTEMAASGMPIVATAHCDIPEVVVHGETGWLCRERSAEDVAGALADALAHPEKLGEYGRAARRLVERKYDVRANRLDSIYQRLLR